MSKHKRLTVQDAVYVDRKTGKVMLDVNRFCVATVLSWRPEVPPGFYGPGIGQLLESEKPKASEKPTKSRGSS